MVITQVYQANKNVEEIKRRNICEIMQEMIMIQMIQIEMTDANPDVAEFFGINTSAESTER